ncbi:MAG: CdaR family protein [bacterium]
MGSLRKNLRLKLFCAFLAICLWGYVKYTQTPLAGPLMELNLVLPLQAMNLSASVIPLGLPKSVTVTIRGGPEVIKGITPDHIKAAVNFKDKNTGTYNFPVEIKSPQNVEIVEKEPDSISVKLESSESRFMDVTVLTRGRPASGYVVGQIKPQRLKALGTESLFKKVRSVVAEVDVTAADSDIVQKVTPAVLDAEGNPVHEMSLFPGVLRVTVPIRSELESRVLPISPNISGTPRQGYLMKSVTLNPATATVIISGKTENPPSSLSTEVFNIEGADCPLSREVQVLKPKGVSVVQGKSVRIMIQITPVKP